MNDYKRAFKIACELLNGNTLYGMDSERIFEVIMNKDGIVDNESYENYILSHMDELDHGQYVSQGESEGSMIRSRQMANKLSQNIIEHARILYPEALGYKGQLTNEQFCEIEKECDIDFYKFGRQNTIYTIRYKGGDKE